MSELKKENKQDEGQGNKSLGVLYTGYLEKKNPVSGSFKKRFVVLTQTILHWFKREEGKDLFGEERGQMGLGNILTVKILDEDSTTLEIQGIDQKKRYFRATSPVVCEEWVSAIRSAIKSHTKRPNAARRASLSAQRAGTINALDGDLFDGENNDDNAAAEKLDVTVSLVSLRSTVTLSEVVVTRNPDWNRVITIASIRPGDELILSTSNGGHVSLSYEQVRMRVEDGLDFDAAVQDVTLASSLKISLCLQPHCQDLLDRTCANNKKNQFDKLQELGKIITSDRACAISTVLSLLVLMAGVNALTSRSIGPQATLLMLFATALSVYNLFTTLQRARYGQQRSNGTGLSREGLPVTLLIHGHTFTSPDAPINDPDSEIPQRFIIGCGHNLGEARRRWDITKHWRATEGVNQVLQEPQPYYFLIHTMYPHYHCGRGRLGHIVYYERPGDFQGSQLAARGVTTEDLVRHWLFTTEYQWSILCQGDETAKSIAVIDIERIKMGDLAGENLTFLKKTISIANQHYPERSFVIFIVNAPMFFSMLWRIVRPMVDENTQKKVRILSKSETLKGMQEHIDISQIPDYYGGQMCCKPGTLDSCRHYSPEILQMNDYVRRLNERNGNSHHNSNNASFYGNDVHNNDGSNNNDNTGPASPRLSPRGSVIPNNNNTTAQATNRVPFQQPTSSSSSSGDYDYDDDENSSKYSHATTPNTANNQQSILKSSASPRRGSLTKGNNMNNNGYGPMAGDDWSVSSHTTVNTSHTASTVSYNSPASPLNNANNGRRMLSIQQQQQYDTNNNGHHQRYIASSPSRR